MDHTDGTEEDDGGGDDGGADGMDEDVNDGGGVDGSGGNGGNGDGGGSEDLGGAGGGEKDNMSDEEGAEEGGGDKVTVWPAVKGTVVSVAYPGYVGTYTIVQKSRGRLGKRYFILTYNGDGLTDEMEEGYEVEVPEHFLRLMKPITSGTIQVIWCNHSRSPPNPHPPTQTPSR